VLDAVRTGFVSPENGNIFRPKAFVFRGGAASAGDNQSWNWSRRAPRVLVLLPLFSKTMESRAKPTPPSFVMQALHALINIKYIGAPICTGSGLFMKAESILLVARKALALRSPVAARHHMHKIANSLITHSLALPFQTWDTNHSYKGEWLRGRKEGRGVYTWPDGSTYEGEYKNGRRHGLGLQTMSDGAV
jgi:hypothetical protein